MLLFLWGAATAEAGCHGSITALERAWAAIAVPAPTTGSGLDATATVLADHGGVAAALKDARGHSGRAGLGAALASAEGWLAANPDARGVEEVRAQLAAARDRCGVAP